MKFVSLKHSGHFLRRFFFQGITIKIIPPSSERIVNLQFSLIQLLFLGTVLCMILAGVIIMSIQVISNSGSSSLVETELGKSQENLDSVTDEIRNLFQTYDVFNTALAGAIKEIGQNQNSTGAAPDADSGARIHSVPELTQSLSTAIKPLQETMVVMQAQKKILSDIPNVWPVVGGGELSMEFGPNVHPIRKIWYIHKGVDIAASSGLAVVASANGRVIEVKYDEVSGYGRTILIEHKYGFMTRYAHLGSMLVNDGDEVVQGQQIGTLGNSGMSTGAHIHFEILLGNQVLDPVSFLKISNSFKRWTGDRPNTWD